MSTTFRVAEDESAMFDGDDDEEEDEQEQVLFRHAPQKNDDLDANDDEEEDDEDEDEQLNLDAILHSGKSMPGMSQLGIDLLSEHSQTGRQTSILEPLSAGESSSSALDFAGVPTQDSAALHTAGIEIASSASSTVASSSAASLPSSGLSSSSSAASLIGQKRKGREERPPLGSLDEPSADGTEVMHTYEMIAPGTNFVGVKGAQRSGSLSSSSSSSVSSSSSAMDIGAVVRSSQHQRRASLLGVPADVEDIYGEEMDRKKHRRRRRQDELPALLEGYLSEAQLQYSAGNYRTAFRLVSEVIRRNPRAYAPFELLGDVHLAIGNIHAGINALVLAAHVKKRDPELFIRAGHLWREEGQTRNAMDCFSNAHQLRPKDFTLVVELALCHEELGEHKKACDLCLRRLDQDSLDPVDRLGALKLIGRCQYHMGQVAKAISTFRAASQLMSELGEADPAILLQHCEALMTKERYQDAVKTVEDYIHLHTIPLVELQLEIAVNYGVCQLHLGHSSRIVSPFSRLRNSDVQEYHDLFYLVASTYKALHKPLEAIQYYTFIAHLPDYDQPFLWRELAECYEEANQPKEAVPFYERVVASPEVDAHSVLRLCSLYLSNDMFEKALSLSEVHSAAFQPEDQALNESSSLYSLIHEPNRSIDSLSKDEVKVQWQKAILHCALGQSDLFLETALPLFDRDPFFSLNGKERKRYAEHTLGYGRGRRPADLKIQTISMVAKPSVAPPSAVASVFEETSESPTVSAETPSPMPKLRKIRKQRKASIFGLLEESACVDLVCKLCFTLMHKNFVDRALDVYTRAFEKMYFHDTQNQLLLFSVGITLYLRQGDFVTAFGKLRDMAHVDDRKALLWNTINHLIVEATSSTRMSDPQKRELRKAYSSFVAKVDTNFPDNVAAHFLHSNMCFWNGSYAAALRGYRTAFQISSEEDKYLSLMIGLTHLFLSKTKRREGKQHRHVLIAVAFLLRYHRSSQSIESLYNLGRAHHALSINDVARNYYQRALQLSESKEAGDHNTPKLDILVRHAAYNLSQLYDEAGADASAEMIRVRFLTI